MSKCNEQLDETNKTHTIDDIVPVNIPKSSQSCVVISQPSLKKRYSPEKHQVNVRKTKVQRGLAYEYKVYKKGQQAITKQVGSKEPKLVKCCKKLKCIQSIPDLLIIEENEFYWKKLSSSEGRYERLRQWRKKIEIRMKGYKNGI